MPATASRVEQSTDAQINDRIRRETERNVAHFAKEDHDEITRRLEALDREWDVERTLEANAASVALLGLGLGALVDRRFFVLPGMVAGFLLQHAIQGWCPPVPVFRRLGFRTATEIALERYALKLLRGDFAELSQNTHERRDVDVRCLMKAVQR
ncbi:DUF2892 domain-containing protein [Nitrospirales bacterium NOB]|nr:DUF2892 domain-containing protein [Nitrospira sp. NTP2]MDL1890478.1 DUF2892 domain-containing protein [Nitrospirales bacterium NOB]RIK57988.1 MAG: hypothetical protein DCC63_12090 [Nitrospira sp.]